MAEKIEIEIAYYQSVVFDYKVITDIGDRYAEDPDFIFLGKGVAVIDLDDQDPTEKVIASLNRQKQKVAADYVVATEKLDEQIQQLLAIEDKSNEQ